MATTLGITEVTAAQNQKEVTINEAIQDLEDLGNAVTAISVAASFTVSGAQYRSGILFRLTDGGVAAAFNMRLPANARMFLVDNQTGETVTVGVDPDADGFDGDTVSIPTGTMVLILCDGTDTRQLQAPLGTTVYDFGFVFETEPTAATVIQRVQITRQITIPADFAGSSGSRDANPGSDYVIDVQNNSVSIGTITISSTGIFSFETVGGTEKVIPAGTLITFISPSSLDGSIAGVAVAIAALY